MRRLLVRTGNAVALARIRTSNGPLARYRGFRYRWRGQELRQCAIELLLVYVQVAILYL